MTIRIPRPINTVLDAAGRRPLVALSTACLAVAAPSAVLNPAVPLVAAVGLLGLCVGMTWKESTIKDLCAIRDGLEGQNALLHHRNRDLERGNATAVTAKIATIPDGGDPRDVA